MHKGLNLVSLSVLLSLGNTYLSLKSQQMQAVSQTSRSSPARSSTWGRKVSTAWRGRMMRLSLLVSEAVRHLLNNHWHLAGPARKVASNAQLHWDPDAPRVHVCGHSPKYAES